MPTIDEIRTLLVRLEQDAGNEAPSQTDLRTNDESVSLLETRLAALLGSPLKGLIAVECAFCRSWLVPKVFGNEHYGPTFDSTLACGLVTVSNFGNLVTIESESFVREEIRVQLVSFISESGLIYVPESLALEHASRPPHTWKDIFFSYL